MKKEVFKHSAGVGEASPSHGSAFAFDLFFFETETLYEVGLDSLVGV